MISFRLFLENTLPKIMYHSSPKDNRESIRQYGLLTKFDQTGDNESINGIYLSDMPSPTNGTDTWQVNVSGINVEEDVSEAPENMGNWYVVYQDINPNRLKLMN